MEAAGHFKTYGVSVLRLWVDTDTDPASTRGVIKLELLQDRWSTEMARHLAGSTRMAESTPSESEASTTSSATTGDYERDLEFDLAALDTSSPWLPERKKP